MSRVPAETSIRPATLEDVPAIRSILAAHGNDGPVVTVDIVGPYVRHLVRHHRALVAVEGDVVVGYGATVDAGIAVHLADLFVLPDRLGHGIGRPLLTAVFEGAERRTTFASDDARALPLYVRAGMAPLWPCLYLNGDAGQVPGAPPSVRVEGAAPARLATLERQWTGANRARDHGFWASLADADPFVVVESGEPAAVGYARARQTGPVRTIDRLVIAPGADPLGVTLAALGRAARGGRLDVMLPGPHPALRPLLEAGFRVTDRDTYMASEPGLVDPQRLLPDGGML